MRVSVRIEFDQLDGQNDQIYTIKTLKANLFFVTRQPIYLFVEGNHFGPCQHLFFSSPSFFFPPKDATFCASFWEIAKEARRV